MSHVVREILYYEQFLLKICISNTTSSDSAKSVWKLQLESIETCAFWIAQVSLVFPFECNQPNGNSADLASAVILEKKIYIFYFYHQITFKSISENLLNGNSVVHMKIIFIFFQNWPNCHSTDYTQTQMECKAFQLHWNSYCYPAGRMFW